MVSNPSSVLIYIAYLPLVVVIAWIARQSGDSAIAMHYLVGAPMMIPWNSIAFRIGWSVNIEIFQRTFEFNLISRTSMLIAMIGKTVAEAAAGMIAAALALILLLSLVSVPFGSISVLPWTLSVLLALIGIMVVGLALSPIMVLTGGRAGYFNAILAFGVTLNGFLFPLSQLPIGIEVIARIFPTSWAMNGLVRSIRDGGWSPELGGELAVSLALSCVWLAFTYFLMKRVEARVRVTGVLGTF